MRGLTGRSRKSHSAPPKPPGDDELLYGVRLIDEIRARQREVTAEEERLLHERSHRASDLGKGGPDQRCWALFSRGIVLLTLTRKELALPDRQLRAHLQAEAEQTRQLQESREFFRITLNSLADGVVTTDAKQQVTFINPVGLKLTGWNHSAEVRGRPFMRFFRLFDETTRVELRKPLETLLRYDDGTSAARELSDAGSQRRGVSGGDHCRTDHE